MAQPVSVCHQWSITGRRASRWPQRRCRDRGARRRRTSVVIDEMSYLASSAASGSALRIARIAVGAVNNAETLCSWITRQNAPASGCATGLPRTSRWSRPPATARTRCRSGRTTQPTSDAVHRPAGAEVVDVAHRPGQRHGVAPLSRTTPFGFPVAARRVEDVQGVGRGHRDGGGVLRVAASSSQSNHAAPRSRKSRLRPGHGLDGSSRSRVCGGRCADMSSAWSTTAGTRWCGRLEDPRSGDQDDGLRVVDAGRSRALGGEAAEHHRVHGHRSGAREHRDRSLGIIMACRSRRGRRPRRLLGQHARESGHLREKIGVVYVRCAGTIAESQIRATDHAASRTCRSERVEARVERGVREPAVHSGQFESYRARVGAVSHSTASAAARQ